MTQKRRDTHSTEFGLWLREQKEIDSSHGYITTNVDYVWQNHKTGQWMFIEEKRYGQQPKFYQKKIFEILSWCGKFHPKFFGFHVLVFENTNPNDGGMFLDGNKINSEQLLRFLQMKRPAVNTPHKEIE
jgi:hypothetical protein